MASIIAALQKILSSECFITHKVIQATLIIIVFVVSFIYVLLLLVILLAVGKLLLKATALKDFFSFKSILFIKKSFVATSNFIHSIH